MFETKIWCLHILVVLLFLRTVLSGDNDYNIIHRDNSYEFGYDTPDSYHYADANRNNLVRGEFGGRNPKTGGIDTTIYTAGPRGFRPQGKNIARKFDLDQRPRPTGSRDDPYYDPYEDPSYSFGFRTRTHSRSENANRVGDVTGSYSYLDDVGERHNVEYIAGKDTGFHVKTPFPDSNPRAFGPLYFRGRGRPIPRGRTSIQKGLDGSYRFVSAGPDQRRTETSDATGHVRGSYTYLDDKGVQHSVHYIAGPETGYRVIKNVKGPHLPTVFPFGRPDVVAPADFYDDIPGKTDIGDVFDTAASGDVRPGGGRAPGAGLRPYGGGGALRPTGGQETDGGRQPGGGRGSGASSTTPGPSSTPGALGGGGGDGFLENGDDLGDFGDDDSQKGASGGVGSGIRPRPGGQRPTSSTPSYGDGDQDNNDDDYDVFGSGVVPAGSSGSNKPFGTSSTTVRPPNRGSSYIPPPEYDDGSYKPFPSRGNQRPTPSSTLSTNKPFPSTGNQAADPFGTAGSKPNDYDDYGSYKPPPRGGKPSVPTPGGFGSTYGTTTRRPVFPSSTFIPPVYSPNPYYPFDCPKCKGTIVTNIGDTYLSVPPGVSVRAHVQAIDLLPIGARYLSPSEQFRTEQLNERNEADIFVRGIENGSDDVRNSTLVTREARNGTDKAPEVEEDILTLDIFNDDAVKGISKNEDVKNSTLVTREINTNSTVPESDISKDVSSTTIRPTETTTIPKNSK